MPKLVTITKRFMARFGNVRCSRCGEPIPEGSEAISRWSAGRSKINKARYYHVYCWESLFYDEGLIESVRSRLRRLKAIARIPR